MATFGERLKELRQYKGITQRDIAKIFGRRWKSTVSNWEKDIRFPSNKDILIKLADYFDVSLDYLLGRVDSPQDRILTREELSTFLPDNIAFVMRISFSGKLSDADKQKIIHELKSAGELPADYKLPS